MASFFGEVLPVSTRSGDDDYDDDGFEVSTQVSPPVVIRWSPEVREEMKTIGTLECKQLVIAVGQCGRAVHSLNIVDKLQLIGTIINERHSVGSLSQRNKDDTCCYIYRDADLKENCICVCPADIPDIQSLHWCETLLNNFNNSVHVIILSSCHVTEYKSDRPPSELNMPFICKLSTGNFQTCKNIPSLPQPNITTGVAAQLLTVCQAKKIPGVLYHMYVETLCIDDIGLVSYKKLLQCTGMKMFKENVKKSDSNEKSNDNSLYI